MDRIKNNRWLIIASVILGICSTISWFILNYIFCETESITCTNFQNFIPSIIEVSIGIEIALIIHDHTRKIQNRENDDLDLTIQDTYYHLWSLHETLRSYIISDKVRSEYSASIQILNLLSQSQGNLSKCGRKLDLETLSDLRLHLILIQKAISVSIDPRGNIEKYWDKNSKNVKTAFTSMKTITRSTFEPYLDIKKRMEWSDSP